MTKPAKLTALFSALLLQAASLHAQFATYSYSGAATGADAVTIAGSTTTFTNATSVTAAGATKAYQVSVNPNTLRLGFDTTAITTVAPSSLVQNQSITPGFGQPSKAFTATISINAINLTVANVSGVNAYSLAAGSSGIYKIEGAENWNGGEFGFRGYLGLTGTITGTVSGTWTIQGPTESASGSFDQSLSFLNYYNYLPALIDTSSYPSYLTFAPIESGGFFTRSESYNFYFVLASQDFATATVDGVTISTGISQVQMSLAGTGFNLTAVPEPSTYAAIFGVCALGLAVYRRRQCRT